MSAAQDPRRVTASVAPAPVILRCSRAARASKDERARAWAVALRGSLRSHLRVTDYGMSAAQDPRRVTASVAPAPVILRCSRAARASKDERAQVRAVALRGSLRFAPQ